MSWRHYLTPVLALTILAIGTFSPAYAGSQKIQRHTSLPEAAPYRVESIATEGVTQDGPTVTQVLSDFETLSREIGQMHDLGMFLVGSDGVVSFDAAAAREANFSDESIQLAGAMTALTNDIVLIAHVDESNDIEKLHVDTSKYPVLEQYFAEASAHLEGITLADAVNGLELQRPQFGWGTSTAYWYCGNWGQPKPSRAADWITHSSSNPSRTLSSWGYHATPNSAGGGWTRPQTYNWWWCGWNTFRDHAYISGTTIREQKYTGWSPPGEPNPEVWLSGPWPYATWPAYVLWWHQWGPGR